jgi:two-component system response regulator AlgR
MKIIVVDDEQPARERLSRLIGELEGYEVIGEAANGREAIELYTALKPEIMLLDIRMPVMDGLEAAQHLTTDETPPAIIFTTAYSDHALEAFNTHAVGYLLKPVRKENLAASLAAARRSTRAQFAQLRTIDKDMGTPKTRTHLCVHIRGNLELIPVDEIYYFRAEDKYVVLYHRNGQSLIEDSLVKLEEEFAGRFMRIHRNALVAKAEVCGLEQSGAGCALKLKHCDQRLSVSRRHLPAVRHFLKRPHP